MQVIRLLGVIVALVIIVATTISVMRTLIIPRATFGAIGRTVDMIVDKLFIVLTKRTSSYKERDTILAGQAAVYLLTLLAVWLLAYVVGFALVLWPSTRHIGIAFRESGSSLFTLGFVAPHSDTSTAVDVVEAGLGLFVVAAQIGYSAHALRRVQSSRDRCHAADVQSGLTRLGSRAVDPHQVGDLRRPR